MGLGITSSGFGEMWLREMLKPTFALSEGMIGKVANGEIWDPEDRPHLGDDAEFVRSKPCKIRGIRRGNACRVNLRGEVYVIGIYSHKEKIREINPNWIYE